MAQEIVRELVSGVWRTVRRQQSGGGGSQPYVRKTITYADVVAGGGTVVAFTVPENDVLTDIALVVPVGFDYSNANGVQVLTPNSSLPAIPYGFSSDTTTIPGGELFGLRVPIAAPDPNISPGLPITGGVGGSDISILFIGFNDDGANGTLLVIGEIVSPSDL